MLRALAAVTGGILFLLPSGGAATTVQILSHASNPGGQSAAASVVDWTRWFVSFLDTDGGTPNPFTDPTGANLGQSFPVFMLAGAFSGTVERAFTVPAGKPFLIPLISNTCIGDPNLPIGDCANFEDSRESTDRVSSLFLSIDDKVIIDAKDAAAVDGLDDELLVDTEESLGLFSVDLPPNSILSDFVGPGAVTLPEAYTAGYFAFADLSPGLHKLEFGGAIPGEFSVRVGDAITVAVPLPPALPLLAGAFAVLGLAGFCRRKTVAGA